ncbi:MAG: hypothetical protein OEM91_08025 [Hyphomicrobiales bacterium]|nr:hypothetical protein [Hyphomicrobiales bacterium]
MHDNTAGHVSNTELDNTLAVAMQVALVGTVFMLAISGTATIAFSLGAAL